MKMVVHPNTRIIYLTTESKDDQYLIGRLAIKLKKKAGVFPIADGQREMQTDISDFLEIAAE